MKIQVIAISLIACICCSGLVGDAAAFSQRGNNMKDEEKPGSSTTVKMLYRLEGAYSIYKYIQVEIEGTGKGVLRYEKYPKNNNKRAEEGNTVSFTVDKATVEKLISLHNKVNFFSLKLNDLNKDKIQVVDVGTTTLMFSNGGKEKTISYGFVENNPLQKILEVYWLLFEQNVPKD